MLSHCYGGGVSDIGDVSSTLRNAASTRGGSWMITFWHTKWWSFLGIERQDVVLTEKEFTRGLHMCMHGLRNATKKQHLEANLEQSAQVLWPTGSTDHVAMRHFGMGAIMRYCSQGVVFEDRSEKLNAVLWASCIFCLTKLYLNRFRVTKKWCAWATVNLSLAIENIASRLINHAYRPTLERITPLGHQPAPTAGPVQASAGGSGDGAPADQTGGTPPAPPPGLKKPAPPVHGGNTADDAAVLANAEEDGRVAVKDGIHCIIGQTFDTSDPGEGDSAPIVGAMIAPCATPPNVPKNNASCLKSAEEERINKKQKPCRMTKADKVKIGKVVNNAIGTDASRALFSGQKIRDWAESHLHVMEIVSSKWSMSRAENALSDLIGKAFPELVLKFAIKLETMPEGKAPRMLIADGDAGQMMALITIKCFEDLLFDWMESRSIKHCDKRSAIERIVKLLDKNGSKVVEGDGSAWDTTCSKEMRDAVENPILHHIVMTLIEFGVVPEQWHHEHMRINTAKDLKLFFKKGAEKCTTTILGIRRSGHRGTSCLNWWVNYVMWTCSIFKAPERFLNVDVKKGEDEAGIQRWWTGVFEGDDSLCALQPPMLSGDAISKYFFAWWDRLGFNMKIVFVDSRATVVGYHIACDNGRITSTYCPELPRAMKNGGVSNSTSVIQAAKDGDVKTVKDVAAAAMIARAADFSGLIPTVSKKYLDYADSLTTATLQDREMSFRAFGEEGHDSTEIRKKIDENNRSVTPTDELSFLKKMGYDATPEEMDKFFLQGWSFEDLLDYDGFKESLPPTWR